MKILTLPKIIITAIILTIVISGVKNSVEMSSSSFLKKKSVSAKRLDELTDDMNIATSKKSFYFDRSDITKPAKKISFAVNSKVKKSHVINQEVEAYIQGSLSFELVEYYNPKEYTTLIKSGDKDLPVSGSLEASNGVVEKIDVTLPSGESIFVEYGSMNQNRFSYNVQGMDKKARGIIYKLDASHYMVSLEDGPHSGTRMKFKNRS
jgi:hypothetical protein